MGLAKDNHLSTKILAISSYIQYLPGVAACKFSPISVPAKVYKRF